MGYEIQVRNFNNGTSLKLIIDTDDIETILEHIKTLKSDHEIIKIKKLVPIVPLSVIQTLEKNLF